MKKFISLLLASLLFTALSYGMESNYDGVDINKKFVPKNANEEKLENILTQQSDKFGKWLNTYSIQQVEKLCKTEISPDYIDSLTETIQSFVQYPILEKKIQLQQYDLTHLNQELQDINLVHKIHILNTIMEEAFILYQQKKDNGKNKNYFNALILMLEKLKQELRKPL